jgi:4-hydroxy-3-methylbut-2-enyl diphosphate reductase
MATIEIAESAGACFGVERALEKVKNVCEKTDKPVHTLGPLIHNPQVVAELDEKGVTVVDAVPDEAGSVLVIRSHGVVPEVITEARAKGLDVVDATCPYVHKVHRYARELSRDGYDVLVVGEAGHAEVEGILGHAPGARAVGSAADLEGLELGDKVGVVVQTTQAKETLDEVVDALEALGKDVCVKNTICEATRERQQAARETASRSDCMVVIGGRISANTTRLAEICSEACEHTHHIETADEIDPSWFDGAERIGVTAGASTPASQIEAVVARIRECVGGGDDGR